MTVAFAWLDGESATEDEKADATDLLTWDAAKLPLSMSPKRRTMAGTLQPWGENKGKVYVAGPFIHAEPIDGDFSGMYRAALDALLAQDERVRNGDAYQIGII